MQEKRVGKKQRNHQLADQETARKREGIRKAIPTKVSPKNGNYVSVLAPSSLRKPLKALQSVRRKQERPHFDQPIHVHKHNPHNTTKSTCGHQERSAVTVADRGNRLMTVVKTVLLKQRQGVAILLKRNGR